MLTFAVGSVLDLGIDGWSLTGVGLVLVVVGGHQWVESRIREAHEDA